MSSRSYVSLLVKTCALLCLCLPLTAATEPVTLTDQHPVATMTLDPKVIATGSPILEVDVTELSNPSQLPIGIAVFITTSNQKIPIGNFAFYPADNKGNFMLDTHTALTRIKNSQNVRLVFELRKLRPSSTWKPVRVTIAPPKWRTQQSTPCHRTTDTCPDIHAHAIRHTTAEAKTQMSVTMSNR